MCSANCSICINKLCCYFAKYSKIVDCVVILRSIINIEKWKCNKFGFVCCLEV